MPDFPTNVPAAGWYSDPADASQERWWGGVQWTHDVRPLAAMPVVAPQPALAQVPGGGINPFAALDAQVVGESAGGLGSASLAAASSVSSFSSFDTGSIASTQGFGGVTPSWQFQSGQPAAGPPPSNGLATAGLVLSLVGLNVPGIVVSALGLRKARGFEDDGDLPVGRKRSRWGLGLGIASVILSIALTLFYLFAFSSLAAMFLQQAESGIVQLEDAEVESLPDSAAADDGTYDRADYEQEILMEYALDEYPAPDSITCPDAGSTSPGSVIVCTIVTGDLTETRTAEYYENGGYAISTTSMSQ